MVSTDREEAGDPDFKEKKMTQKDAAMEQKRLAIIYGEKNLAWWFGTKCQKCCGVYPRFHTADSTKRDNCWYECDVCGKQTNIQVMPWVAAEAWNKGEFAEGQIRFC